MSSLFSPPVPVGVDEHGQSILGEVPRLFGGDVLEYIMVGVATLPAHGYHNICHSAVSVSYRPLVVTFLSL